MHTWGHHITLFVSSVSGIFDIQTEVDCSFLLRSFQEAVGIVNHIKIHIEDVEIGHPTKVLLALKTLTTWAPLPPLPHNINFFKHATFDTPTVYKFLVTAEAKLNKPKNNYFCADHFVVKKMKINPTRIWKNHSNRTDGKKKNLLLISYLLSSTCLNFDCLSIKFMLQAAFIHIFIILN